MLPEQQVDDKEFLALASTSKYLPRLQLMGSQNSEVKKGLIPCGRWALVTGQNLEDVGAELRVYIVAMRLKAIDLGGDPIVAYFDAKLDAFKKIAERSLVEETGPMAGPEFLVYLPTEKRFCALFCANKTMKREAPNIRNLLKKPATLKIHLITKGKYMWHGPIVTGCSIPLPTPDPEELLKVYNAFVNPPASETEDASAEEKAATTRER